MEAKHSNKKKTYINFLKKKFGKNWMAGRRNRESTKTTRKMCLQCYCWLLCVFCIHRTWTDWRNLLENLSVQVWVGSNWCLTLLKLWSCQCTLDPKVDAFTGGRGAVNTWVLSLRHQQKHCTTTPPGESRWDSETAKDRHTERGQRMREELRTQRRTKC